MHLFRRHQVDDESSDPNLRLVVGLGNPGAQYASTRHNAGYMVVNTLARKHGASFKGSKQRADIARIAVDGIPVLLALPVTFMNDSGEAVTRLLQYYRIPLPRLLVVCDDIDLPFGVLRIRPGGSSGGNRGLRSIVQLLGTDAFARLRLGVGRPAGGAKNYVLAPFNGQEEPLLGELLQTGADAVESWVRSGTEITMNRFNRDWLPELQKLQ